MKKITTLLLLALVSISLSAQFRGKMNFNTMGKTRSFTVYSAIEGYRYEFNEDGQQGVIIVKSDSQQVIILMPQQKMAMKSSPDNPMSMMNDPLRAFEQNKTSGILKETGKETINGIPCTKSVLYNRENPSQKMFTMWYSDKYKFPMKMVNHIDGSQNSGMEMSDVEPWTPDPQSFEIPPGYQVMDVPAMPQK
ncbi:MAG: DUF4412 domain-containing protein [Bacteroidales bacterium]|nr:DUF4412 domain-containing protein [Bacteroidales bacterium]